MKTTVALYHRFGPPLEVLEVAQRELEAPGAGEVLVDEILAPINPADLNTLEGIYPIRPDHFPAVPGVEGVATVREVGAGVESLEPGMRVLLPHRYGTWRSAGVLPAEGLIVVPEGVPLLEAAMMKINPATAWRMLHDFVPPQPGGWVLQNAANSAVGRHVIAMAKTLGLRTVNLVRRPELVDELLGEGADVVLLDEERPPIAEATGGEPIHLALNAVGGESVLRLAGALAPGGTVVTYGAMSRRAAKLPAGMLIFNDLAFRGFWVSRWYQQAAQGESEAMFAHLFELARTGVIRTPVEQVVPVEEIIAAVTRAQEGGRSGKIVIGQLPTPPEGAALA